MKQFLVCILAFLYLGSSAGATVHLHYCKGELVDIQLGQQEHSPCSGCKTSKEKQCKMSCCKDEHKMVKLEKDHQKSAEAHFQFLQQLSNAEPASFLELSAADIISVAETLPFSHAPPLKKHSPLHILHCNFRI